MTLGSFDVVFDDGADEFVSELNLLDDEIVRFAVKFEGRAGPSSVLDGEFVDFRLLSVEEGEFVDFRLRLDETVSETVPVVLPWEISFDTASSDDFASGQAFAGTVEIPPNSLTSEPLTLVPLRVAANDLVEGNEVFRVIVPIEGRLPTALVDSVIQSAEFSSEDVTIMDADSAEIFIEVESGSGIVEGGTAMFSVGLRGNLATDDIFVEWSVSCGGGITAEDFMGDFINSCPSGTVTIESLASFVTFAVSTNDDSVLEGMETFTVTLTSVLPDLSGRITIPATEDSASVTILDNDAVGVAIGFSPVDYEVSEGAGIVELTVSVLSGEIEDGSSVVVNVMTADGTAVAGEDYIPFVGTWTFSSSMTEATVTVDITDDAVVEGLKLSFLELSSTSFELSSTSDVVISTSRAVVTIEDDDSGEITVSAVSPSITEGDTAMFIVELGDGVTADQTIGLEWSVNCGAVFRVTTADFDGFGGDCPFGTVTIAAGSSSEDFPIMTLDDSVLESMETFTVTLTSVSPDLSGRITISATEDSASVTILDNDVVEIGFEQLSYSVLEDAGSVTLNVLVLSGEIEDGSSVTVVGITLDGTAVAPGDYTAVIGTLTFTSSMTEATVRVDITDDAVVEGAETFILELSSTSDVVISTSRAVVTIEDDDSGEITVSAVSPSVTEGDTAMFIVELGDGVTADQTIGLEWSVNCGAGIGVTAADFDGFGVDCPFGTATIGRLESFVTFPIFTFDDNVVEGIEVLTVTLTSVSPDLGGRITISGAMNSASVTIDDNDRSSIPILPVRPVDPGPSPRPGRSPDSPVIGFERVEGSLHLSIWENEGSVTLTVRALSGEIDRDVVVNVRTLDGSAVAGEDYTALTEEEQTFTLTSRMTEMTVTVPILDDRDDERDEFFQVELYIGDDSSDRLVAEVTILDNADHPSSVGRLLPPNAGCSQPPDDDPSDRTVILLVNCEPTN